MLVCSTLLTGWPGVPGMVATAEAAQLKEVQGGSVALVGGADAVTVSIQTVTLSKSFLTFSTSLGADVPSNPADGQVSGRLSSSSTITFERVGTTGTVTISWAVAEFVSGVSVQRGSRSFAGTTENVTISSVTLSKSFPIISYRVFGSTYGSDDFVVAKLSSSTNLELIQNSSTPASPNSVEWQVIQHDDVTVQTGDVSFSTSDSSVTATITSANTDKAWLTYTYRTNNGTSSNIGQKLVRGRVTDSTTLTFDRSSTGVAVDLTYHLVEFTDATVVQGGSRNLSTSTTQANVTIEQVQPAAAMAVGGYMMRGGRSAYSGDDDPSVAWMTLEVTSGTNLRITRGATFSTSADVGWFVIEFPGRAEISAGAFTKSTGSAPVNQTISHGLNETPKALILWTAGKTSTSWSGDYLFAFGFSDGVNSGKSIATASANETATARASRRIANKAITIVQWGETTLAEADLNSWNSSSFTLRWTTNNSSAYIINYIAIGGQDVSAKVLGWTMRTSTGNQSITGIGFQPHVVMLAHVGSGYTSAPPANDTHGAIGLGVMRSDGEQWATATFTTNNASPSQAKRHQRTDSALLALANTGAVTKQASMVSMGSDGFTLNYSNANSSAGQVISLALRGVNVGVGSFLKSTGSSGTTQTVSGTGFRPSAVLLSSVQDTTQTSAEAHFRLGLGGATLNAQGALAIAEADDVTTIDTEAVHRTSKAFIVANNTVQVTNAEADLVAFTTNGFQLTWTTNNAVATEILYLAIAPMAVTQVRLVFFTAERHDHRVLLQWRTGYEADNLGFHVYREVNGSRTRLTSSPVAGSGLMVARRATTTGHAYAWWDAAPVEGGTYWLEDLDFSGKSTWHGPVAPGAGAWSGASTADSPILAGLSQAALSGPGVLITEWPEGTPRDWGPPEASLASRRATHQALAGQPAIKIGVRASGWYRLTRDALVAAGLDVHVDPRTLQLFVEGAEQAIRVTGEADGQFDAGDVVEFYGLGVDTPYTETRVYWLVWGAQVGRRIGSIPASGGPTPTGFAATVERKDRSIYFAALLNGDSENWFGPLVSESGTELTLPLIDRLPGEAASITVVLQGVTGDETETPNHRVGVRVNGTEVGEMVFAGRASRSDSFVVPAAALTEGANIVRLEARGGPGDLSLVDVIRVTYPRRYRAVGDLLRAAVTGPAVVTIDGFGAGAVRVFDVTDPLEPVELPAAPAAGGVGTAVAVAVPGSGLRTVLAVSDGGARGAAWLQANAPSSWHAAGRSAAYVVITPAIFREAMEPLRAWRAAEGLTTAVVDIDDLYDEFSFGAKTPAAVKAFLMSAAAAWTEPPRYVVLAGDATLDPRNYSGLGEADFIPTKLVETEFLETASDDWFADADGDGLPELAAVGRLPVRTVQSASAIVTKIVAYEAAPDDPSWNTRALFVADENDADYDFEQLSEQLIGSVSGDYLVSRVYAGQIGDPGVAMSAIGAALAQGQVLVNYIGHGSTRVWGKSGELLTVDAVAGWTNGDRLPLVVAMNCLNGFFHGVYAPEESLAEALIRTPAGGAVGVWASSGLTSGHEQARVNEKLLQMVFGGTADRIGDAVMAAKAATTDGDVRRTWIFFGDPALRLKGDNDGLPDWWERQYGLNPYSGSGDDGPDGDPDGDGVTNAEEYEAGTHPRAFFRRYLAEGAQSGFFATQFALVNPDAENTARVLLRFQTESGASVSRFVWLPPLARRTVQAGDVAGLTQTAFATLVESDEPVVVDRTMSWPGGAHAETALEAPAAEWHLAEGATHSGFQLFYLLHNPGAEAAEVEVSYLRPAPWPAVVRTYAVEPRSRFTIWVNQVPELAAAEVSAVVRVTNAIPINVERAMYLGRDGQILAAGHAAAGVTTPATQWLLAEGATGPYFDLFLLISNPGESEAWVTTTYLLPDGDVVPREYRVAGRSRLTVWVDAEDPRLADTAVAAVVTSTNAVPIVVERAMWWPGPAAGGWREAHASAGATQPGTRWAFADGAVGGTQQTETYLLVANTSSTEGVVQITLLLEEGEAVTRTFPMAAQSRLNVAVGQVFPEAHGRRFGGLVESLAPWAVDLVVERSMYWNSGGARWGAGTNVLATRLE